MHSQKRLHAPRRLHAARARVHFLAELNCALSSPVTASERSNGLTRRHAGPLSAMCRFRAQFRLKRTNTIQETATLRIAA